jgi:hypothetical protein
MNSSISINIYCHKLLQVCDNKKWDTKKIKKRITLNMTNYTLVMIQINCNTGWWVGLWCLNGTFNNISVLLVEETWENHWPVISHKQIISRNVVWSTSHNEQGLNSLVVIGTDCKSNYSLFDFYKSSEKNS